MLSPYQLGKIRKNPEDHTVSELKKYLKKYKIKYDHLNKKDLIKLVKLQTQNKKTIVKKATNKNMNIKKRDTKKKIINKMSEMFIELHKNRLERKKQLYNIESNNLYDNPVIWNYKNFDIYKWYQIIYAKFGKGDVRKMYDTLIDFLNTHQDYALDYLILFIYSIGEDNYKQVKRRMSVGRENIDIRTYEGFKESIRDLELEEEEYKASSDIVNVETEFIEFSRFSIALQERQDIGGKESLYFYKTVGIDGGKKKECVKKCFEYILKKPIGNEYKEYHKMLKKCKEENINIVLSSVRYKKDYYDETTGFKVQDPRHKHRKIILFKLNKIKPIYIYKCDKPKGTILIDIDKKHADVILNNEVQQNEDIYATGRSFYVKEKDTYRLLKYNTKDMLKDNMRISERDITYDLIDNMREDDPIVHIYDKGSPNRKDTLLEPHKIEKKFLFIDYETVNDFSTQNTIIPISIQYYEISKLSSEIITSKDVKIEIGLNCTDKILNILTSSVDTVYTIVTFGGSGFDHYILYTDLIKKLPDQISNVFFSGTRLLNFNINGVHKLFDLNKHITTSLKEACNGYDIKTKKGEISFYEIQKKYDTLTEKEFIKYLKNNKKFIEYSKNDIACTYNLMSKYVGTLHEIQFMKPYAVKITDYCSYGGMMRDVFNNNLRKKKIKIPTFKKNMIGYYKDIVKNRVAGRVQLFNNIKIILDFIHSPDASGMYPYVMAVKDVYYPCGTIIECEKYEDMPNDKIGFFYCDEIDQSNTKLKIIPEKTKKGNNWDTCKILNNIFISTVKINMLIKHKCKFKIRNGIYFTEKIKSCDLFSFILDMMKHKSKEDILKENNDKKYNPAKRQLLKSMMLILSGKLAEKIYVKETKIASINKIKELRLSGKKVRVLDMIYGGTTEKAMIEYNTTEAEKIDKHSRPIYLSTLIYDYAQEYMYDYVYSKVPYRELLYTDTDSNAMRSKTFRKWCNKVKNINIPHWEEVEKYDERYKTSKIFSYSNETKVIGSFADEFKDFNYNKGYYLKKKGYFVTNGNEYKLTFAGIQQKDIYIKDGDYEEIQKMNDKERNDYYHNSENTIKNKANEFIEDLYKFKTTRVLCQTIRKNKNTISMSLETYVKKISI